MCHFARKNHRLSFDVFASADSLFWALCHVPESIEGASLCRFGQNAYRVTLPGACVRFRIFDQGGRTQLVAQFKSCASSLWQRLKELLRAFLPLRQQPNEAPPPREPDSKPPKQAARSVPQFVDECMENPHMQGRIIFTSKAQDLALVCRFRHVDQLEHVMVKLTQAAGLIRGGLHRGMSSKDFWEKEVGLPVTLQLSDTQEQKYGSHYDAMHDGKLLRGRMHITLGFGHSPADCMSIHFAVCEDCGAIIITRFGEHGPTARS
jgi:hypothetical protein